MTRNWRAIQKTLDWLINQELGLVILVLVILAFVVNCG